MTSTTTQKAAVAERRAHAIEILQRLLPVGSTVYTTLLHTSRSGMMRVIKVVVTDGHGPQDVSHLVAQATGSRYDPARGGLIVSGVGMDMGYSVVYGLSHALFADGFGCTGEQHGPQRCTANDHVNERTPDYTPGRTHSDPGYALHHSWL